MLSMLDELDMSFALGASDYLLKPIKRDLLVDTVLKHIRDKENATVLVVDDLEENRNMIVEAGEDFPEQIPDNYIWMSAGQLKEFIKYNNFVNVQARCLLSSLRFS